MNHRGSVPVLAACRVCLEVLAEAPVTTKPGEGALYDPPLCEYDEATLLLQFRHDLERESEFVRGPLPTLC